MLLGEATKGSTESFLPRLLGIEHPVAADVTATPTPQILDRVQFRGISGQELNGDVVGNHQVVGCMPSGPIHDNQQFVVGVGSGEVVQVKAHQFGIDPGQQEAKHFPGMGGDTGVQIKVGKAWLDHGLWGAPSLCPAPSQYRFQPETSLIKKEHSSLGRQEELSRHFSRFF